MKYLTTFPTYQTKVTERRRFSFQSKTMQFIFPCTLYTYESRISKSRLEFMVLGQLYHLLLKVKVLHESNRCQLTAGICLCVSEFLKIASWFLCQLNWNIGYFLMIKNCLVNLFTFSSLKQQLSSSDWEVFN